MQTFRWKPFVHQILALQANAVIITTAVASVAIAVAALADGLVFVTGGGVVVALGRATADRDVVVLDAVVLGGVLVVRLKEPVDVIIERLELHDFVQGHIFELHLLVVLLAAVSQRQRALERAVVHIVNLKQLLKRYVMLVGVGVLLLIDLNQLLLGLLVDLQVLEIQLLLLKYLLLVHFFHLLRFRHYLLASSLCKVLGLLVAGLDQVLLLELKELEHELQAKQVKN